MNKEIEMEIINGRHMPSSFTAMLLQTSEKKLEKKNLLGIKDLKPLKGEIKSWKY